MDTNHMLTRSYEIRMLRRKLADHKSNKAFGSKYYDASEHARDEARYSELVHADPKRIERQIDRAMAQGDMDTSSTLAKDLEAALEARKARALAYWAGEEDRDV